MPGVRKSLL